MANNSEKPELQWIEDLVELAFVVTGSLIIGLMLMLVGCGKAIAGMWVDDPPPPRDGPEGLS